MGKFFCDSIAAGEALHGSPVPLHRRTHSVFRFLGAVAGLLLSAAVARGQVTFTGSQVQIGGGQHGR
jgi:hypothetical protein